MLELWATIGRMCLDNAFHEELFERAGYQAGFDDLHDLCHFLRDTQGLRLSRWEISTVNRIATERIVSSAEGKEIEQIKSVAEDHAVLKIRECWKSELQFPKDLELCGLVGLACVDRRFRPGLHAATDPHGKEVKALKKFLADRKSSPMFHLSSAEVVLVNQLMRAGNDSMAQHFEEFRNTRWDSPKQCCSGYTSIDGGPDDEPFIFVSETRLTIDGSQELWDELFKLDIATVSSRRRPG